MEQGTLSTTSQKQLARIHKEYHKFVNAYFLSLTNNQHVAADLTQSTFEGLARYLLKGSIEGNERRLVFHIARRAYAYYVRREKHQQHLAEIYAAVSPDRHSE